MDAGTGANAPVERSIGLLREHRDEMALWLALEVLQLDPVALEDAELTRCLGLCQERLEERLRARTSAPHEHASLERPELADRAPAAPPDDHRYGGH